MTAGAVAVGGAIGGVCGASAGLFVIVLAVLGGVVAALVVIAGAAFLVTLALTPRQQRDEIRAGYDRLLRPRMVPPSERCQMLTDLLEEGRAILDRVSDTTDLSKEALDRLWIDANTWDARAAVKTSQIMHTSGSPLWYPRVSDLPGLRLTDRKTHVELKLTLIGKWVEELGR